MSVNKLTDDKLFLNYSNDNLVHIARVHTLAPTQTFRTVLRFFCFYVHFLHSLETMSTFRNRYETCYYSEKLL